MKYAEIGTMQRTAKIALEPTGWGMPYQKLHDMTDVSGYEMYVLERTGNFNNPFQEAMENIYRQRGWFGLILKDVVRDGGKGTDDKGRLNLSYISHAGTEWEKEHGVWAPQSGWYVPNDECEKINGIVVSFVPGTIVPFETVQDRKEAVKRFKKYGLNPDYVSYFYRLDNYRGNERFAGRGFDPGVGDVGRFGVGLGGRPSYSGSGGVAALPAYEKQEAVMKVRAVPEEAKAK